MKQFLYGGLTALAGTTLIAMLVALLTIRMGLVPINADEAPSGLEKKLLPLVLHTSIARHSSEQLGNGAATDDDIAAGAEIYNGMCAQCHGRLNGRESVLGASFYPPAPQFPANGTSFTQAEVFWIVKHGIRNTSMPAWRNLLSDEGIQQVAAFVKRMDSVPAAADARATQNEPVRAEKNDK